MLIILLHKREPDKVSPGCEWWRKVFVTDESIETLTCKIYPEDMATLPEHVRQKSYIEHSRFMALSSEVQEAEMSYLMKAKQVHRKHYSTSHNHLHVYMFTGI